MNVEIYSAPSEITAGVGGDLVAKDYDPKCKSVCREALDLLSQEKVASLVSGDFVGKFQAFKQDLVYYLEGKYDGDGIAYMAVLNNDDFIALKLLYDYALGPAEYGGFETYDSCVNMDFIIYADMSIILSKELNKIYLVEVEFDSEKTEIYEGLGTEPDHCYTTNIGVFKRENENVNASISTLKGKKDIENGNVVFEDKEASRILKFLVEKASFY